MAEALVGGAFLSASLQVLFDRMASREFVNFFRGRKQEEKLLKKLKRTLRALNALLNDAEDKQFTNKEVKDWLDDLKDAVYHADDLLDEINTEALRCKLEAEFPSSTNQVQNLFSSSNNTFHEKLDGIIVTLEEFWNQKDLIGLKEGVIGRKLSQRLAETSLVDESGVYGRDDDKEQIIKLLLSDDASGNQICVIPIVGMGGVGKTTLAQLVYNDERVKQHFDIESWVCVSEDFDVFRVTKTILTAVTSSPSDVNDDLNLLQVKLRGSRRGKKFLIVLDDVWNENYNVWDKLSSPFKDGAQGSKIIVTTRNGIVAKVMKTAGVSSHDLKHLTDEDCWSLFAKHAFESGDPSAHSNLEEIGKEIVKKCKGLPLAVKTLGGLLRSKLEVEEWDNILKSEMWDLPNDNNDILVALRLSYHYLPSHLKQCFAYCAIIPKGYEFEKQKLVQSWMALNFVQSKSNRSMEEIGDEYFRELISRSLFQQSRGNKFLMHDLVNDLAKFVSGDFCFVLKDDKPHHISEKVRHFSYVSGQYDDAFVKFKALTEVKCLRTFRPFPEEGKNSWTGRCLTNKVLLDILPTLTSLRVLSLSCYDITELPDSIGNLNRLRFLNLSYTRIRRLPDSISNLYNLQTLLLRHCSFLSELPTNMGKLINLRYLDIERTRLREMPMQMSRLKDLQHLSNFIVGKDSGSRINELRELRHLHGTLSISWLQNVIDARHALEANLKDKKDLEKLTLEWERGSSTDDSQHERDVLDKLQPHTNVKSLTIENYGGTRFPDWLGDHSFSNIMSLRLGNCSHCFFLPSLGQLRSLKDLTITDMNGIRKVGSEFYGNASLIKPFQSLESLSFYRMPEWEEWCILGVGEFSCLLELVISDCPKLTGELPNQLSSLMSLEISRCQKLVGSLPDGRMAILSNQIGLQPEHHLSSLERLEISNILNLPQELCRLTNLEVLFIRRCSNLLSFPEMGLPPMLKSLCIDECESLQSFPISGLPTALKRLRILSCRELEFPLSEEMERLEELSLYKSCDSLKSLPLGFFPKLCFLEIWGCTNLETLSIPNGLQNLTQLIIWSCPNMVSFPEGGLPAPNLSSFFIRDCKKLKLLPERMHTLLPSLQSLTIINCPELESFPDGGLPSNLTFLYICYNCEKLMNRRMETLQRLHSLKTFTISGWGGESFPEEWLLPSSLTSLQIWHLQYLKSLNHNGL